MQERKIRQIMKKTVVEFVLPVLCLPLSSFSGSTPGNVRWCPSLALVETTGDPQSVAVSFRLGWSPLFCPACFLSALGPLVVHLMTQEDCQYHFPLPPEGGSSAIRRVGTLVSTPTPAECCSVFREDGGSVTLPLRHMSGSVPDSFR